MDSDNGNGQTITMSDNKTTLRALALINNCYEYIMDLTPNGVVITDAINLVQTNKEKLTMSTKKEDNGSKENEERLEKSQEEKTREIDQTTIHIF